MSAALTFTTEPVESVAPSVPFVLDGTTYTAYPPKQAAWALLFEASSRRAGAEALSSVGTFLDACLDPSDAAQIERRLYDRSDSLDLRDLLAIVDALVAEWEPYLAEEFADLTGTPNRAARRAAVRKKPADHPGPGGRARTAARRPAEDG